MNRLLSNRYVILLSRMVLGSIFIVASVDKITSPEAFAVSIEAYRLLPLSLVNIAALIIPWVELLCGVFLLAGVLVRASAVLTGAMLVVFLGGILAAMARGLTIDCGCFGPSHATPVGWMRVLEDVGMILPALHLSFRPMPQFSVENLLDTVRND
jgi:putative oxidoreductase